MAVVFMMVAVLAGSFVFARLSGTLETMESEGSEMAADAAATMDFVWPLIPIILIIVFIVFLLMSSQRCVSYYG